MEKDRIQAFSDGMIAILITIMVLELKIPAGKSDSAHWSALKELRPIFFSYVLSFVFLGIYWNNHHHMLAATRRINGAVLWANLHLLFWLSLFPFFTGWMGENHFAELPTAAYGVVLFMAGVAYYVLKMTIIAAQAEDHVLAEALGSDVKGKISPVIYLVAIPLAYVNRWIAVALYILVALMWLVPDRRIESRIDRA
ncbi:MAG: potassium channel family protein [Actinomycetota bacterium]|nr:potassium channel family protein [Actinomycetota bacterium]